MPKIINDARAKIIASAKRELLESGYTRLSLRGVASASGIAVGTIYNYFEDKDNLIATIMLDDWRLSMNEIHSCGGEQKDLIDGLVGIRTAITRFAEIYEGIWRQFSLAGGDPDVMKKRHAVIRRQIEDEIASFIPAERAEEAAPLLPMAAEAVLTAALRPTVTEEEFRVFFSAAFQPFFS